MSGKVQTRLYTALKIIGWTVTYALALEFASLTGSSRSGALLGATMIVIAVSRIVAKIRRGMSDQSTG